LGDDDVAAVCQGLECSTSSESLGPGGNQIKGNRVTAVATLIARNDQLTFISILNHRGGDKSLVQIVNALKTNTTLKLLNVYHCDSLRSIGQQCIWAFLQNIKEHPSLNEICFPDGCINVQVQEMW
jgi:hypothetical protein